MPSKQALAVSEIEQRYDLDFIHAVILNGLFLLHDGKPRVAHAIYPTVGKLINIRCMTSSHIDPDEFPGKYSLFDAEARRRTRRDACYYDSRVSSYFSFLFEPSLTIMRPHCRRGAACFSRLICILAV